MTAFRIASRVATLKPSPTLAITAKAKALAAQGADVCSFGAGEPDFATPEHIRRAAEQAIEEGWTRYVAVPGLPELRSTVAKHLADQFGLDYEPDEVIVTVGGKHALYEIFQCLLEPGDEVLIPSPYWVSYPAQVELAGGVPVAVPASAETGWKVRAEDIAAHCGERTRVLVLNSPSNPTGAALDRDELEAIARVAIDKDLFVISDEIYARLVYDGFEFHSFPTLDARLRERTVVVGGWSKTYAMTGWRLGWAAGPRPLIAAMSALQSQSTSNAPSMLQRAAIAALEGPHDFLAAWLEAFDRRRRAIAGALEALPGVTCPMPRGAFYVFPDFSGVLDGKWRGEPLGTSMRLAQYLLEEHLVAVVPGDAFGAPGCLRLSYATSDAVIEEGLRRIRSAIEALS